MAEHFGAKERDAGPVNDREHAIRTVLRSGFRVPRDTFITDDIPVLLSKLAQLPGSRTDEGPPS